MDPVVMRAALEKAVIAGMERASAAPMQWGEDDCALWCANIIRDATGIDFARKFRDRYATRRGAMRVLGRGGLLKAVRDVARRRKWKRTDPANAKPGDIGLVWTVFDGKPVLATTICRAAGWFVSRNERGFTAVPASDVAACWSILGDVVSGHRVNMAAIRKPWQAPTSAACHEPVSITIGLTALLEGTALAGFGGTIVSGVLSVGFSLASSLLQPHAGVGGYSGELSSTGVPSVQVTERQSTPYKRYIFGETFVGSSLCFEQVKPPYLTVGALLCEGPIEGVKAVHIGTNPLTFSSMLESTILTPLAISGQPSYSTRLRSCFRYGSSSQAVDPLILARYASVGAQFRQRGVATAVMEYHFGASQTEFLTLWGQTARPNAYYIVRGSKVYDPRIPSHVRQPDRADYDDNDSYIAAYEAAQATWEWTRNATLLQAFYLTQEWGGRIAPSRIRWDKIADSADYDDTVMACKDGTLIPRHTIDGVVVLNERPFEVIQKLLTANRARLIAANGYIWIDSSKRKTPIATIHDQILAGPVKYLSSKEKRELINKLQIRLPASDREYQIVDGPTLVREDLQLIDREVLPGTVSFDYTNDHRRAQRLQKALLSTSRLGKSITCSVDVSIFGIASDELIGNVVNFYSSLFSPMNGEYLITGLELSPDDLSILSLVLTEYDGSIEDDYNAAVDEQDFTFEAVDVS